MNQGRDDSHTEAYLPSDGEQIYSETYGSKAAPFLNSMSHGSKKRSLRRFIAFVVVLVVAAAGYFLVTHFTKGGDAQKLAGKVSMSAGELRSVILANHLTVYWAGPTDGARYALVVKPASIFVRYLPNGQGLDSTTTSYRVIATYSQKSAFLITQSAGTVVGNVGFTNFDGNAVFYTKTRPTNVYMGIKDKDIQLEIFDPGIDQALGLALLHNQIQLIS